MDLVEVYSLIEALLKLTEVGSQRRTVARCQLDEVPRDREPSACPWKLDAANCVIVWSHPFNLDRIYHCCFSNTILL